MEDVARSQQLAYEQCLRRIENLVQLKTAPLNADGSLLTDEEYGEQRMALLGEKARLQKLLQGAGEGGQKCLELSENTFEFSSTARDRFANGDFLVKKEILSTVGSNLTLRDKKLSIEAKEPFRILENALSPVSLINSTFEPENRGLVQRPNPENITLSPTLCGGRDEVRTYGDKLRGAAALIYAHFRKELLRV